jgi:hypothetical protein
MFEDVADDDKALMLLWNEARRRHEPILGDKQVVAFCEHFAGEVRDHSSPLRQVTSSPCNRNPSLTDPAGIPKPPSGTMGIWSTKQHPAENHHGRTRPPSIAPCFLIV